MNEKKKVIVICGPTASGKTSLGIDVAKRLNGEIISCDSMQIYKDMDIGSAKPTAEEQSQAKHHLVDFVSPDQRYSVADFKKDAEVKIEEILNEGKVPILVGGTGLYINSIIYNINYNEIETDLDYRKELSEKSIEYIFEKALQIDPEATKKISMHDRKRLSRILEIYHSTGKTKTQLEKESRGEIKYDFLIYILDWPREELYNRINYRVDKMIEAGLVEEVENLKKKYNSFPTAMQGLGYKEISDYLDGICTLDFAIDKIKKDTRHYAKRQITWFKSYKDAQWLDAKNTNNCDKIVEDFLEEKK
jgi:tRNA dimethylallyltransferase